MLHTIIINIDGRTSILLGVQTSNTLKFVLQVIDKLHVL